MAAKSGFIFFVTHLVPYPPVRGIELRMFKLLSWLRAEGYRVILMLPVEFIDSHTLQELRKIVYEVHWTRPALGTRLGRRLPYLRQKIWEPLKPYLRPAPIQHQLDATNPQHGHDSVGSHQKKAELCPDSLVDLVAKLARRYRPQALIAEYIFMTPCFANLPADTLRILDTEDLFSRKRDQVLAFGIADPYACTEDEERQHLLRADLIVAIQGREAEMLKNLVPERKVILTPIDFATADNVPVNNEDSNIVLVIGADNELNIHGLRAFLKECWPEIKTAHPAARLHVVGKVGAKCRIDDQSIQYTPRVDDLTEVYREARVAINPTIAGTGLKIKSAEALAHGKPLVAWPNGVEGLDYSGEPPFIECRSWHEFGSAVVRLLRSDSDAKTLANRALSYARAQFNAPKVYASLRACLLEHASQNHEAGLANDPVRVTYQGQTTWSDS
ncbi:MAG: glycosyltransferase [Pyrinomonadaceae bacterium]